MNPPAESLLYERGVYVFGGGGGAGHGSRIAVESDGCLVLLLLPPPPPSPPHSQFWQLSAYNVYSTGPGGVQTSADCVPGVRDAGPAVRRRLIKILCRERMRHKLAKIARLHCKVM